VEEGERDFESRRMGVLGVLSAEAAALRGKEGRGKRKVGEWVGHVGAGEGEDEAAARREMRRELRGVKERILGEREAFVSLESGAAKVEETLEALNGIRSGREAVVKPRELACDVEVLAQVAEFAVEFAAQLRDDTMSDVTPGTMLEGLRRTWGGAGGAAIRWAALGAFLAGAQPSPSPSSSLSPLAAPQGSDLPSSSPSEPSATQVGVVAWLRKVPAVGVHAMLGPLEVEVADMARQRAPRAPRQRLGELERPDDLAGEDLGAGEGKTEMDTNMDLMYQHLRRLSKDDAGGGGPGGGGPTVFDRFLVNPDSFAETVENCFMLSFLVKQGRASLLPKEDAPVASSPREDASETTSAPTGVQHSGQLKVGAARPPSAEEYADSGLANAQFCMRLDYAEWVALSRRLQAEREVLASVRPPRCKDARLASLGRGARLGQPPQDIAAGPSPAPTTYMSDSP